MLTAYPRRSRCDNPAPLGGVGVRKLLDWRKLLIYSHRWLGIIVGVVFVAWCVSGIVLMYYGSGEPGSVADQAIVDAGERFDRDPGHRDSAEACLANCTPCATLAPRSCRKHRGLVYTSAVWAVAVFLARH